MLLLRQILLVLLLLIQLPLPLQIPPARSIMPTDMKSAGPVLYAIQLRVLEIFSSAMSGRFGLVMSRRRMLGGK